MSRAYAAKLAQETMAILERGHYTAPSGRVVRIDALRDEAVARTEDFPPERPVAVVPSPGYEPRFEVTNESTLTAAARLAAGRPAVLNFASAKNPGGGFLSGAHAQEESLARSSALYSCLAGRPMYAYHQERPNPLYSHWAIYSPDVPVFRSNEGPLREALYTCAFVTCPAVNAGAVQKNRPADVSRILPIMRERVHRVLAIMAQKGHDTLVLGAWGCGVFGNDAADIALLFRQALDADFAKTFRHVVFAVLDGSPERRFIRPFEEHFLRAS
ncbi:TIGR02452 family protein [Pendulispora brunnea]|uniref:TIGR02452 family protein n=1 Tax=Pendulispora brunnea TaxID=2905690 RepID=A0ABZ2KIK2_9BACT